MEGTVVRGGGRLTGDDVYRGIVRPATSHVLMLTVSINLYTTSVIAVCCSE